MAARKRWRAPRATVVVALLATSGCVPENLGDGLDVVNETGTKLYVTGQAVPADGGRTRLSFSDCNDTDLVASTKDGVELAVLTERWCPSQTWTITGLGQATLDE